MDFKLPELGEGVYEAEMTRWLVTVGDHVKPGQGLLEVLTDKATMEVPSPFAGVILTLGVEPGKQVKVGQPVLTYERLDDDPPKAKPAEVKIPARQEPSGSLTATDIHVKAAPSVRQMARNIGVDLATIHGSGPEGRILIDDLTPRTSVAASKTETKSEVLKPGTRVKLQGLRRVMAERMTQSKNTIPHFTYVDECDVTELVRARVSLRDSYAAKGVKLTYLAFFAKAIAQVLKEVPQVNASLDEAAGEIVLHDHYNLGIAVAAPTGLIVPVVRDADRKSLFDLAKEIERLTNDARTGHSRLEDQRGGTFTITSIGNLGGLFATPIINHPEVGILGIGKIVQRPVFDSRGQVAPADMVYLSFSFDHRLIDGAVAVTFGNAVIKRLKNPVELIAGL